jgi:secreted trypsin-like serine protease
MRRRPRLALAGALAAISLLVPASAGAQSQDSVQPKIVGGSTASISQYPWQAAVVFTGSGSAHSRQFCGGELVTSRIVLTAGHCVVDTDPDCTIPVSVCLPSDPGGDGTVKLDPNDVDVVLGRTTLSDTSQGAEVGVAGVAYQSNYDGDYQGDGVPRFDVGYLVLNAPSAQPQIHIASSAERSLWDPGDPVDISGWGSTSESGGTQDTLRATTVNIVSDPTCSSDYGADFDSATMVCAAATGKDTCAGDSGGPLQASIGAGAYRLVGITGWGDGCARPGKPGVYTRVADTTMSPLIAADIANLESTFSLPPESPFGSATPTPAGKKAKSSAHPFAKCKRIHNKKKRRRCIKKVKRKLKTA